MWAAVLLLVLCQQPMDPTRQAQAAEMLNQARATAETDRILDGNARTKREFAQRFNKLISAMRDFESAYSHNAGQIWPAKQAAQLDAAMRELSTSPGWRKPSN